MVIAPVLANLGPLEELNFKPNPGEVRSSAIFCLFEKNRVRLELTSLDPNIYYCAEVLSNSSLLYILLPRSWTIFKNIITQAESNKNAKSLRVCFPLPGG